MTPTTIDQGALEASQHDLAPCPFCGSRAMGPHAGTSLWWISCTKCEATQSHGQKEAVVAAWNERAKNV